ncbi:MarR family winged helix-turn-helix transcriptional regulator [Peribacillus muralis]|uniref:MarR family winged helix-turn-helix transcriptional regulator n=1 Tax=Peribacillus muralis TaxID=264697 RepID=UPI00070D0152|nr:MarR family transcriptional regulator [Peribacillus muralis]
MNNEKISLLIDRYMKVSFYVNKMGELLIKDQICDVLTNEQYYTLRFIAQQGLCTSTEISEAFYINKSAVTSNINRLEGKGLIERQQDRSDRRVFHLKLSKEGAELLRETEHKIHKLVESIMTNFEYEEIVRFLDTYEKLSQIFIQMKNGKQEEM